MLEEKTKQKIIDFVSIQPRSIDEISKHISRNWRTANRYVDKITEEGIIAIKIFREGTRGALKVAYFISRTSGNFSVFQQELFEKIKLGRTKEDFSPFDIWQYVPDTKKQAFLEQQEDESDLALNKDLIDLMKGAKKEVLIFSGNLSWANLEAKKVKVLDLFESLVKKGIRIKILTRVDIASLKNVKKVLGINYKLAKELIKIRHREQPIRAVIIDDQVARFKEIKDPKDYKKGELEKKSYLFYEFYDKDWLSWIKKVFSDLFLISIDANKRIEDLEKIKQLR
jgi:hypothetical protein